MLYAKWGKMIAYNQNIIENNSINYSTVKFDATCLKLYLSYVLFYEMNRYYLNEQKKIISTAKI